MHLVAAGLGRWWFEGGAVLPVCGDSQRRRQCLVTTAHRALPACGGSALGIPRGTARSNTASAVCSRCGGACTRCCGGAGQVVEISRGGGSTLQPQRTEPCQCASGQPWAYHGALEDQMQILKCAAGALEPAPGATAGLGRWSSVGVAVVLPISGDFQEEESALGNHHSAQSPISVCAASPGHAMGYCKIKCSLCSVQQVWWSRHWVLRLGWAGGLWGLWFCQFGEISRGGGSTRQPQRTEPCQCVSGQS